ncbi:tRNA lysidine(34) synthetase TilS [Colwelliaceae bacterium 6471]
MPRIPSLLSAYFSQHPSKPIVIAYSGGVDSQVLLHALIALKSANSINNPLSVCHVNHGLSDNASLWQNKAEQLCHLHDIPLIICNVNVKKQRQKSTEALARAARYQAFKQEVVQPSLIVTGHHSDDQAETFLLALKRGAGLQGLSAMMVETPLGQHTLVRPLLDVSRQEIIDYAHDHQLTWIEDESNSEICYDRNFLRHQVIPVLKERWPSIVATINRSAQHCREQQGLVNELAEIDLLSCVTSKTGLLIAPLKALSTARFNNAIRLFLSKQNCLMPTVEQLNQLHSQLSAQSDKSPEVKVGEHWFRRFKGTIYLTKSFADLSAWQYQLSLLASDNIPKNCVVDLPDDLGKLEFYLTENQQKRLDEVHCHFEGCMQAPSENQQVTIRFSHENPRCLPDFRQHHRSLKKILQELAIAPWQRKRIPFVYYDDQLVAALGYFVCKEYLPQPDQKHLRVIWCYKGNAK